MAETPLPSQRPGEILGSVRQQFLAVSAQQNGGLLVHVDVANEAAVDDVVLFTAGQHHVFRQLVLYHIPADSYNQLSNLQH